MQKTDAVLIFDLDGTILAVNSFPHWVRYMLSGRFGNLSWRERLWLSLGAAKILVQRKLLRHGHAAAKQRFRLLWTEALQKDTEQKALHDFTVFLQRHVRPNMKSVLEFVGQGADAVLATSAAGEYAGELGGQLGFRHILATGDLDNFGEQKRNRVLALLAAEGWDDRPRIFFTDHADDLPLIKECRRTLWFGGDKELSEVRKQVSQADIVACYDLPDAEIMKLLAL